MAVGLFAAFVAWCAPAQTPTVTVVGADPQNGVKLITTSARGRFALPIEASADLAQFHATVDDFRAPDGGTVSVTATLNDQPTDTAIAVKQADRPRLGVAGIFPMAGDYKSNIVLFYGGTRQASIPFTVTRQQNAVSVQIDAVDTAATTRSPFSGADVALRFVLKENAGRAVPIYQPVLVNFALKETDKTLKQARYSGVELRNLRPESLLVGPLQSREHVLEVRGIRDAGEYSGTLRVGSEDTTPAEKPITIFVKDSAWMAFLFVFLGVASSYVVRFWAKEERPKLDALRRVANLRDDLDGVEKSAGKPPDSAAKIFAGLRAQLAKIERNLTQGTGGDQTASLDEINARISKLPPWLTLGNRLAAVDPAATVEKNLHDWETLGNAYFLTPGAKADEFDKQLADANTALDQALKQAVVKQITDFQATVAAFKATHPTASLKDVDDLVTSARANADNGNLQSAANDLKAARGKYCQAMAAELDKALSGPAPLGFKEADWKKLGDDLRAQLPAVTAEADPDMALRLFDKVNNAYIRAIVTALANLIPARKKAIDASSTVDTKLRPGLQEQLDGAAADLKAAQIELESGDWNGPLDHYKKAADAVQAVDKVVAGSGGGQQGVHEIGAAIAQFIAPLSEALNLSTSQSVPGRPERKQSIADRLSSMIRQYDLVFNIGLLLIATILGLKLLWADNAVWGGFKDYAIAFLWGLGLQQVGGASFEGLPALTKKIADGGNAAS
jgi:hypothetical protein